MNKSIAVGDLNKGDVILFSGHEFTVSGVSHLGDGGIRIYVGALDSEGLCFHAHGPSTPVSRVRKARPELPKEIGSVIYDVRYANYSSDIVDKYLVRVSEVFWCDSVGDTELEDDIVSFSLTPVDNGER